MLSIVYDAYNGEAIADGHAYNKANELIELHKLTGEVVYNSASSHVIDSIRLLVAKGKISNNDVIYKFNSADGEKSIKVDKNGRLEFWPEGFCDHSMNFLSELFSLESD